MEVVELSDYVAQERFLCFLLAPTPALQQAQPPIQAVDIARPIPVWAKVEQMHREWPEEGPLTQSERVDGNCVDMHDAWPLPKVDAATHRPFRFASVPALERSLIASRNPPQDEPSRFGGAVASMGNLYTAPPGVENR